MPFVAHTQPNAVPPDALAYGFTTAAAAVIALRGRWPLLTLAVATVLTSAYLYWGYPYGPVLLSLSVAVYSVARSRSARTAALAAAVSVAWLLVHVIVGRGVAAGMLAGVPVSAWIVVPFAVGVAMRINREAHARARAEWAQRLADTERLRVAGEVHDIVGHGLAAIAMQAEIALHVLPKQPGHAEVALSAIARTSREALEELRATLAGLSGADERSPLPGLARLPDLVARMSDSGVPVTVLSTGEQRELPAPADLAAYRVIQESLTNVLRHAGPATVTVRLGYEPDQLRIDVRDTGRANGPIQPGHGIAGMRRRAEALGGSLQAEPAAGGGFHVAARLPIA
jgi:signal transduction histidine kinase